MKNLKIANLAKTYGTENLRFFFPASPLQTFAGLFSFTSSDDEQIVVEAKAVERYNRFVVDNYKMVLQPIDSTYAHQDFYICDFESLAESMPDRYYVMIGDKNVLLDKIAESV